MTEKRRQLLWFLLSTGILGMLIYFADYRGFIGVLLGAHLGYVALATVCGCFTLVVWSVVWHRFFRLLDINLRFQQSLKLLLAGTFLNAVTPLGRFGGEPFIAHLIARRTDATFPQALSSVSSSDLSNALPFVTFGTSAIVYIGLFGTVQNVVSNITLWVVLLIALSMLTIYLLWFGGIQDITTYFEGLGTAEWEWEFGRLQPYIETLTVRGQKLLSRMRVVGEHPREVLLTIFVSHIAVLGHIGAVYFALLSVDVEPVAQTILLVVALSAFLTFSPTPGGMGTFEAGFAGLIVVFFPVTGATATSIAILYRIGTYLPGVICGYISLLSLRRAGTV